MDPTLLVGAWLIGTTPPEPDPTTTSAASSSEHPYRTVVHEPKGDEFDVQRQLDAETPGFASAVVIDSNDVRQRGDDLGDRLDRVSGVVVRSLGGLGQFSSVSLRGSAPQQVPIFIDGVPIDSALAGMVDLSQQPLDAVQRIEVYRGYVPIEFGRGGLGGAVNLVGRVHRGPMRVQGRAGYGSFRARSVASSVARQVGDDASLLVSLGYAGAKGDFPFFDNGGTPIFTGDDSTTRRQNNGYDRLQGLVRVDGRRSGWRYSSQLSLFGQMQGVPGVTNVQSTETSNDTVRARSISSLRHSIGRPGGRIEWVGGATFEWRHYQDPLGEVGVAIDDERSAMYDGYLSPRLRLPLWKGAFLGLTSDVRAEHLDLDEQVLGVSSANTGDAIRQRVSVGAGAELEQFLWAGRVHVVPAVRADAILSRFAVAPGEGEFEDEAIDANTVALTPRIGARVRVIEGLSVRGSAGQYLRPPTMMELFGDRGFVVGNEALLPERGTSVDGGLVFDRIFAEHQLYAHAAGFGVWNENSIQWVFNGLAARPDNLAGSRLHGMEASLRASLWRRHAELEVQYTWLDTFNESPEVEQHGKSLPGRPRHDLYAALSAGHRFDGRVDWEPRLRYTIEHISGTFLDPSGRYGLPPRTFHGVGVVATFAGFVHMGVDVRNLTDVRQTEITPVAGPPNPYPVPISDFIGYPLPGRSVWVSVGVEWPAPKRVQPSPAGG